MASSVNDRYHDEFGFYSPMPMTRAVRNQPPGLRRYAERVEAEEAEAG